YRTAENGLEGFRSLAENLADLVVCDVEMPHLDGLKFLRLVHNRPQLKDIPIIILTGNHDRDVKLKGLEEGASDFLTKPFDMAELVARVKIHLKIKMLQDDLRAARSHFEQLSNTDPLTSLYNRRFFTEILEAELQRAKRLDSELTLLVVDIDHFKAVNDQYGHQAGDGVLVAVTDTFRKVLRSYDVASRYGGEEFAIILPGTSLQAGVEVAERLRETVSALRFEALRQEGGVTISVGAASLMADGADNSESLLKRADQALYLAKHNGRNRVEAMPGGAPPGRAALRQPATT
ncbi:diguanylate cyclase, partial [Geomonas sp.]|uniref:GGDEF domain-containing response regulator n=1 Tax=Geomonas sp. TaxID=2651584 RepID=UPI002B46C9DB